MPGMVGPGRLTGWIPKSINVGYLVYLKYCVPLLSTRIASMLVESIQATLNLDLAMMPPSPKYVHCSLQGFG